MPTIEDGVEVYPYRPPRQMGDAYFSQANPVSAQLYEWRDEATGALLGTQKNVRIISIAGYVSFGAGAPTPLEFVVTIDGNTIIYQQVNPATATNYMPREAPHVAANSQNLRPMGSDYTDQVKAFLLEGRSVKIEARITWAVQPTPLVLRVKWARWTP